MSKRQHYEILIIGSGEAGKYLAWTMARAGKRTAVVERGIQRYRHAGERVDVRRSDRHARQASIHGFARRNLRSPNDGGGTHRVVCGSGPPCAQELRAKLRLKNVFIEEGVEDA